MLDVKINIPYIKALRDGIDIKNKLYNLIYRTKKVSITNDITTDAITSLLEEFNNLYILSFGVNYNTIAVDNEHILINKLELLIADLNLAVTALQEALHILFIKTIQSILATKDGNITMLTSIAATCEDKLTLANTYNSIDKKYFDPNKNIELNDAIGIFTYRQEVVDHKQFYALLVDYLYLVKDTTVLDNFYRVLHTFSKTTNNEYFTNINSIQTIVADQEIPVSNITLDYFKTVVTDLTNITKIAPVKYIGNIIGYLETWEIDLFNNNKSLCINYSEVNCDKLSNIPILDLDHIKLLLTTIINNVDSSVDYITNIYLALEDIIAEANLTMSKYLSTEDYTKRTFIDSYYNNLVIITIEVLYSYILNCVNGNDNMLIYANSCLNEYDV